MINYYLKKARERNIFQIIAGSCRLACKVFRIYRKEKKVKNLDYFHLNSLLPKEENLSRENIANWLYSNDRCVMRYISSRIDELIKDDNSKKSLLKSADDACAGKFYIYTKFYDLGNSIDWNIDLTGSGRWPFWFVSWYRFPDNSPLRGDYRHIWELNRHQHLIFLALAWYITDDEIYSDAIFMHIISWIDQNPIYYTLNWYSAMEVALRLISWIFAISLVQKSIHANASNLSVVMKSIVQHFKYLEDNLSIDISQDDGNVKLRNNHTIIELCGLIISSSFINSVIKVEMKKPIDFIKTLLLDEIRFQTYKDGLNVEQATNYQRFTLEALLVTALFSDDNNFKKSLIEIADKQLNALDALRINQNHFILVGDEDNGRSFTTRPYSLPNDMSEVIEMRNALKFTSSYIKSDEPKVLPDSGHWCWHGYFGEMPVIVYFRAGKMDFPNMPDYAPHVHSDLLSFSIFINGCPVFVDSGTYSYHNIYKRNVLRSDRSHNTIKLNNIDQMNILGLFNTNQHAEGILIDYDNVSVTGKMILIKNNKHISLQRKISIDDDSKNIIISDSVNSVFCHKIEWFLNIHPNYKVSDNVIFYNDVYFKVDGLPKFSLEKSYYSPEYGSILDSYRLVAVDCPNSNFPYARQWKISLLS